MTSTGLASGCSPRASFSSRSLSGWRSMGSGCSVMFLLDHVTPRSAIPSWAPGRFAVSVHARGTDTASPAQSREQTAISAPEHLKQPRLQLVLAEQVPPFDPDEPPAQLHQCLLAAPLGKN